MEEITSSEILLTSGRSSNSTRSVAALRRVSFELPPRKRTSEATDGRGDTTASSSSVSDNRSLSRLTVAVRRVKSSDTSTLSSSDSTDNRQHQQQRSKTIKAMQQERCPLQQALSTKSVMKGSRKTETDNVCKTITAITSPFLNRTNLEACLPSHAWFEPRPKIDRIVGLTIHCFALSMVVLLRVGACFLAKFTQFVLMMVLHSSVERGQIAVAPLSREQIGRSTVCRLGHFYLVLAKIGQHLNTRDTELSPFSFHAYPTNQQDSADPVRNRVVSLHPQQNQPIRNRVSPQPQQNHNPEPPQDRLLQHHYSPHSQSQEYHRHHHRQRHHRSRTTPQKQHLNLLFRQPPPSPSQQQQNRSKSPALALARHDDQNDNTPTCSISTMTVVSHDLSLASSCGSMENISNVTDLNYDVMTSSTDVEQKNLWR